MKTVDAVAGDFLGVHEGVVPVLPHCGSDDRKVAHLDYTHPAPLRVRYAACRVHNAVEAVGGTN